MENSNLLPGAAGDVTDLDDIENSCSLMIEKLKNGELPIFGNEETGNIIASEDEEEAEGVMEELEVMKESRLASRNFRAINALRDMILAGNTLSWGVFGWNVPRWLKVFLLGEQAVLSYEKIQMLLQDEDYHYGISVLMGRNIGGEE